MEKDLIYETKHVWKSFHNFANRTEAQLYSMNNSLAEVHPELVSEWSKKNKIKPTEISIGSHKKVIWRCEKGHEWENI